MLCGPSVICTQTYRDYPATLFRSRADSGSSAIAAVIAEEVAGTLVSVVRIHDCTAECIRVRVGHVLRQRSLVRVGVIVVRITNASTATMGVSTTRRSASARTAGTGRAPTLLAGEATVAGKPGRTVVGRVAGKVVLVMKVVLDRTDIAGAIGHGVNDVMTGLLNALSPRGGRRCCTTVQADHQRSGQAGRSMNLH